FNGEHFSVERISSHCFVCTFARQDYRDVVSCKLGYEIEWNTCRVCHRFVEVRNHFRNRFSKVFSSQSEFMMFSTELRRRFAGECEFIRFLDFRVSGSSAFVAYAERFYSIALFDLAHHCEHSSGIQASAEKHAKRYFRNQSQAHALFQEVLELLEIDV